MVLARRTQSQLAEFYMVDLHDHMCILETFLHTPSLLWGGEIGTVNSAHPTESPEHELVR